MERKFSDNRVFDRKACAVILLLILGTWPYSFSVNAQNASAVQTSPQEVSGNEISALIRSTIVAVAQANQTGNYSVLHALSAESFKSNNTPADVAYLFRPMRLQNIDLSGTVLLDPKIVGGAQLTTDGRLGLKGFFETTPDLITFDLIYFYEANEWRIASISIGIQPAE